MKTAISKSDLLRNACFASLLALPLLSQAPAYAWNGRIANGGGAAAAPASSPKAYCLPTDSVTDSTPTASTPAPAPSATPSSVPAPAAAAVEGYPILIQTGHGDSGVWAAQIQFGSATQGRSRLAGYADVVSASGSAATDGTIDLKSSPQSPFRFELVIDTSQGGRNGFEATLVDADLFTGAPLSNIPYKCWIKR